MPHTPNVGLWSLAHRKYGPLSTFLTFEDAQQTMADVIRDEPDWTDDLRVVPFRFGIEK
jgi:hypothetical protein